MAIAQALEDIKDSCGVHRALEFGRNLDCPWRLIFPNFDLYPVADIRSDLVPYRFENAEDVLRMSVFDERAGIGHAIEGGLYRHLTFRAKLLLDIVREQHVRSAPIAFFDGGCELVLFHRIRSSVRFYRARVVWHSY